MTNTNVIILDDERRKRGLPPPVTEALIALRTMLEIAAPWVVLIAGFALLIGIVLTAGVR
jgi:hypothetical protein